MPQDKKPIGLRKQKAVADKTSVSKMVKDPSVGPSYSELSKKNPTTKDSSDYKLGYKVGASNAKRGKLTNPDKKGNPQNGWYPFRGMGSGVINKFFGEAENKSYAEGRFEGEKRYFKKKK
jgi:hypothetical protein